MIVQFEYAETCESGDYPVQKNHRNTPENCRSECVKLHSVESKDKIVKTPVFLIKIVRKIADET